MYIALGEGKGVAYTWNVLIQLWVCTLFPLSFYSSSVYPSLLPHSPLPLSLCLHPSLPLLFPIREWLEGLPALVDSAVFTYLSILPSHSAQSLASLRQQETNFCVSMLRAKARHMHIFCAFKATCRNKLQLNLWKHKGHRCINDTWLCPILI